MKKLARAIQLIELACVKFAKKSAMPFDPTYTQEQLAQYVLLRSDHIPLSGYAVGNPNEFVWKFIPNLPLSYLTPIKKDWAAWFDGEQSEWEYNHGDERKGHFEKWIHNPNEKPIILMEGTDGRAHIWDGHHRVGMAHKVNMPTVPVLLGRRNSSLANGQSDMDTDAERDTDTNSTNFKENT